MKKKIESQLYRLGEEECKNGSELSNLGDQISDNTISHINEYKERNRLERQKAEAKLNFIS